jgi:anti-sigma B factor antagonist
MEMQERTIGSVTILDLTGRITAAGDSSLRDKIHSLVFQEKRHVLLNLAGVPTMDSSALGELVAAHTTVSRAGGQIKLVNLTKRIHDLLTITRLATVFDTFDTEADAIASFHVGV